MLTQGVFSKLVDMATQDILLLLSLGIIVLWTTRLARSKGLNPWLWGVGVVLLIALAWNFSRQFLGPVVMAPLIFLLLFRSLLFRKNRRPDSIPCPSCGAPDTGGLNFCVQCGWDLSRSGGEATVSEQEAVATLEQTSEAQPVEQAREPDVAPVSQANEVRASVDEPVEAGRGEGMPEQQPFAEPVLAQEAVSDPVDQAVVIPPVPVEPPPARPLPTPANLTERGVILFNQGRFQEAIDQFTKAIALDPKYREAWERRAETYGRMGRAERQKADQRRLEAF
jgi:tetratricopeptide (TPR) repeat protein